MSEQNKLSTQSLDSKNENIAQQIIDASTVEETRDLTALFNLNTQKRNVLRVLKMNNLLDKVTDQMIERFEKNVMIDVSIVLKMNDNIVEISKKVQDKIKNTVENMTGLEVVNVNVNISNVISD